jgi:hypothetical protein
MTNCLKYLIETINPPKNPDSDVKYIPLQSIICEPLEFKIKRCIFIGHTIRKVRKDRSEQITNISLVKDCILLGESESIKYEYIRNITKINSRVIRLHIFGDINNYDGKITIRDSLSTIIFQFEEDKTGQFIDDILRYIRSYKKYNNFDKSVFGFKTYKLYFKINSNIN